MQILYVEDSESDFTILARKLKKYNDAVVSFELSQATTMKQAFEKLTKNTYDAVLLDLNLPDSDSLTTLTYFREHYPDMPVVALTGNEDPQIGIDVLRAGAQEYIAKKYVDGAPVAHTIQSSIYRKKAEKALFKKAHYDELTGLHKMVLFEDIVRKMITRATRYNIHEALYFIDLDGFKTVNDTYGHEAGNLVIKEAAKRITHSVRASDIVARFGGDEFAVYLCSQGVVTGSGDHYNKVAKSIVKEIEKPYHVDGQTITIGCSIGIAKFPEHADNYEELLALADKAMYGAKKDGQSSISFAEKVA